MTTETDKQIAERVLCQKDVPVKAALWMEDARKLARRLFARCEADEAKGKDELREKAEPWVWWERSEGFSVGPPSKGALANVYTVEEAENICKAIRAAMRSRAEGVADEFRQIGVLGSWGNVEFFDGVFTQLGDKLYVKKSAAPSPGDK